MLLQEARRVILHLFKTSDNIKIIDTEKCWQLVNAFDL